MREKSIETRLRESIKKRGGVAFKFTSPSTDGVPDRLVCLPVDRMYLVETKAPGRTLRPTQRIIRDLLATMGITVHVVDSYEKLDDFLNLIDCDDL